MFDTGSKERGFTLVELLVVMAILAVLIGISVAGLGYAMRRSRNIARQAAMANLDRALESFYSEEQEYPVLGSTTDFTDMSDLPATVLEEFLEGSWEAPDSTTVYYLSDGFLYSVCVNQEESGTTADSWICSGPGIGDSGYPPSEGGDCTTGICGDCGSWDDNVFSDGC